MIDESLPPSVLETIRLIGRKWAVNILYELMNEALSFSEIKNRIQGISSSVLSDLLNTFIDNHIVEKKIIAISPKKTEYFITDFGNVLCEILENIMDWGDSLILKRKSAVKIHRD